MAGARQKQSAEPPSRDDAPPEPAVDRLSVAERAKLAMDSWEPSLLSHLLGIEDDRDRDPD